MHSFVTTASLLATTLTSIASAIPLRSSVVKRDASTQVAVYYGQGAGQPRLNVYCDDPNIDIIPVGFVSGWPKKPGNGGWPSADFGNQCGGTEMAGTKMFKTCSQLVQDVAYCHTKGKKILISIGGHADSTQVLASDADGEEFADYMWHMFGPTPAGWDGPRPFGASVVDGFDFDVEANGNVGYGAMAKRLRANMQSDDPNGKYLLTAAPQCPTPDAQIGDAISQADFDYLFIQFYNTKWCSARAALDHTYGSADQNGGKPTDISFLNWAQWVNDNAAGNPSLFIGLPGSTSALGDSTMYLSPSDAQTLLRRFYPHSSFGGVMVWDATYAKNNNDFVGSIKKALNQCDCDSDVCHTSTTTTTTTTSTTTTRTSTTTPVITTTTSSSTASTTLSTTWSVSSTTTTRASMVSTTTSTTSSVSSTTTSYSAAPTTTSATTSVSSTTTTRSSTTATTTSTTSSISWSTTTSPAVSSTTTSQTTNSATTTLGTSTSTTRESSTTTTYSHSTRPYGSSTTALETSSATTVESTTSSTTYSHATPPFGGSTTTSETTSEPTTTGESSTSTTKYSHPTPPFGVSTTSESSSSTTTSSHSVPPFGDSTTSALSSASTTTTFSHSLGISTPTGTTTSPSVDATTSSVSYEWGSWLSTSTSLQSVDPTSSSSSAEHTWSPWSTTSSSPKPVDPTTSSSSSTGHTWAPWSTTSMSADPISSSAWGPWPTTPSDVYVTTTTTVYTDICPTGFTRVTATITATVTVTDTVNQPNGKDAPWPTGPAGVPTGFYATTTVCSTGCAATPVTVTVTIPVPTDAITNTVVPTAATSAVSTPVRAASGKPTGVASGTESWSALANGSPTATPGKVNGVKTFTGGAAVDQAPATAFSVAVCVVLAVAGLIL